MTSLLSQSWKQVPVLRLKLDFTFASRDNMIFLNTRFCIKISVKMATYYGYALYV